MRLPKNLAREQGNQLLYTRKKTFYENQSGIGGTLLPTDINYENNHLPVSSTN